MSTSLANWKKEGPVKVMEIVSTTKPSSSSLFKTWDSTECPLSHERDVSTLEALAAGTRGLRSEGLPKLTAIGVNIAASAESTNGIGAWLKKYDISGSGSQLKKEGNCTVASITYSNGEVRHPIC